MNGLSVTPNAAMAQERIRDIERSARNHSRLLGGRDLEPEVPPTRRLLGVRWLIRSDSRLSGA